MKFTEDVPMEKDPAIMGYTPVPPMYGKPPYGHGGVF